jgi:hypothetical protein
MVTAGIAARQKYGSDYAVAGKDGVHPGWAGQLIMAYAFLKALGLDGDLGTFTVDLRTGKASATEGHEVKSFEGGVLTAESRRYPFCATGAPDRDHSIRSGMTLVPFNAELNRLMLVVKGAPAAGCRVTWGSISRTYPADALAKGVNLAEDFETNPFSEAFDKVDAAVAAKQAFETKQVKRIFHGKEGRKDMEGAVKKTEGERAARVEAIRAAFVPVTHVIRIEAP